MTEQISISDSESSKAERLAKFIGSVVEHDKDTVEFWSEASASEHANAMIQLSNYAESMSVQTGIGKDPNDVFPGFPKPKSTLAEN